MPFTGGHLSFDEEMKARFGGKVYRLSLSAGTTCPNRDGRCSAGGCIFCSAGGSGEFASDALLPVKEQIALAKERVAAKLGRNFAGYMAYFQSFTSTYYRSEEEFASLKEKISEAFMQPEVLALSAATRPDCLPQEMVDFLAELNSRKPVYVELGLQTAHEDTARYINRGYPLTVFEDAFQRLKEAGLKVVVHVIIGLPGEDRERSLESARFLAGLKAKTDGSPIDGVKLQILQVLKGTELAKRMPDEVSIDLMNQQIFLKDGKVLPCYNMSAYTDILKEMLEILPPEVTVHRLTGDPPKRLLIFPKWTADKKKTMNYIRNALTIREAQR